MPEGINAGLLSAQNLVNANAPAMPLSAVAALSESMRTGALTAADIMDRVGELGKTQRKHKILSLKQEINELSDPELSAAKHAIQLAGGDTARLQSAQAQAALPNVEPNAELQAAQIVAQKQAMEDAANMAKFPAAGFFDKAAPAYGIESPLTPEGKTDWAKKAKIGAQIALHNAEQQEAKDKMANIITHTAKVGDTDVLISVTKQGQPVSPEEVAALQRKANTPFQLAPGTLSVMPAGVAPTQPTASSAAPVVVPKATPEQRAQLVSIGVSPTDAAAMDDKTVSIMLSPSTVTSQQPAAPPVVTPTAQTGGTGSVIPGVGVSLGSTTSRNSQGMALLKDFNNEKSVQNLFQAQQAMSSMRNQVEASRKNPTGANDISIIFSFMRSIDPGSTVREGEFATAQNSAGIPEKIRVSYNKALNGERLSQEQRENFLQSSERNVSAHASTAESVRNRYLGQAKQLGVSEELFQPFAAAPAGTPATGGGGGGPVITLSTGRRVRRDVNGNYFDAP